MSSPEMVLLWGKIHLVPSQGNYRGCLHLPWTKVLISSGEGIIFCQKDKVWFQDTQRIYNIVQRWLLKCNYTSAIFKF